MYQKNSWIAANISGSPCVRFINIYLHFAVRFIGKQEDYDNSYVWLGVVMPKYRYTQSCNSIFGGRGSVADYKMSVYLSNYLAD